VTLQLYKAVSPCYITAVWIIIKQWLDAEQTKNTHFCKRKDIGKYIEKDQLLPHMIKEEKSK